MRPRRAALVALLLLAAAPLAGQGIRRPTSDRVRQEQQKRGPRTAADSAKARRDSLKNQPLVTWDPADSVGQALMTKDGYQVVRYKADSVTFMARTKVITLRSSEKERSVVEREGSILVARTIEYEDSTADVYATGDKIVLRDPARNDDLDAKKELKFNFKQQVGTMRDFTTSTKSGETWYVAGHAGAFVGDSTAAKANSVLFVDGTITSCDDSILHYHFAVKEGKRISGNTMVARSVVMYIQDVPVFWFPFIFQDARSGRRSGILTPRFGFAELLRNSPTYRRNVENLGYYFALSDYYDASVSLDWRSAANATTVDPGWVRLNGDVRYQWRNRFLSGRLAMSQHALSSGSKNTSFSWSHQQDFSIRSKLTFNFNYVTNTTVQRQTALSTLAAVATIGSQINYQRDFGLVQMQLGGSQRQYPGRPQLDREFPSLNLTAKPIELTKWLLWTPTFQFGESQSLHMDSQGDFGRQYVAKADASLDSVKVDRNTRTSHLTFNTPFKIGDWTLNPSVRMQDRENDYPELRVIVDPADTSKRSNRIFKRTYLTTLDVDLGLALPILRITQFGLDKWNIVPNVTMSNADPGPQFVRSERTGSKWVSQGKRFAYGVTVSPTFYGLFNAHGLFGIDKLRHSINPAFSWSYSPAATVSDDYLAALGRSPNGNLSGFAQNRLAMTLGTNIEMKLRQTGDSASMSPEGGKKVKLLSLTFTQLTWDFEKAKHTKSGFASDNFGATVRSDLLPGFDFGVDYSLFQGSVLNDSAKFSPFLTSVRASVNLGAESPLVAWIGRLVGGGRGAGRDSGAATVPPQQTPGSRLGSPQQSVAGSGLRGQQIDMPSGKSFDLSLSFSLSQQRKLTGANVIQYDPSLQCAGLKDINPIQYDLCVRNALAAPPIADQSNTLTTAGGSVIQYPPQENIQSRMSFMLTEKWSAAWSTNYDVARAQFGSQSVSLVRDMHDWRAIFGFTQAPNGAFSFTFNVALKAEPDLKFDYNRSSYHQTGTALP